MVRAAVERIVRDAGLTGWARQRALRTAALAALVTPVGLGLVAFAVGGPVAASWGGGHALRVWAAGAAWGGAYVGFVVAFVVCGLTNMAVWL